MMDSSQNDAGNGEDDNHGGNRQEAERAHYQLRLFVAGASINSMRAITNLKHICETHLSNQYSLEIIDVHQQKELAEHHQILALPLLIKQLPLPERRLIGDMSDTEKVLRGLGVIN